MTTEPFSVWAVIHGRLGKPFADSTQLLQTTQRSYIRCGASSGTRLVLTNDDTGFSSHLMRGVR